ncbi:2A51: chromate transporter, chromate ion transporter (CHR) family [Rubrobacter radiotolerans]|uniref:2A51: chromate transporter, chromate ion transporter (CHR) family n=1 Tax=Rubrobacter radiotolerans TaxID=42256 RepID=A0A023X749_RUBRA|nr:chromate efflux transporter [Rubrobacter radiotolerans]AHY47860.1 2A51: chromate transporter, chromate ion transporter (CHR) family [Rubrobacter radiotolerans]MDX5892499.1 chromate efflux transporter [Rubrobacter radiotolerans]SMC07790.1 chromate transporter [Rubrobacter radiotolerans DSM 5868]
MRDEVGFREALLFWLKLGFINFGGPAGQISIMHRELVEGRGWVSEGQFLRALNFCMVLPGPEAQQVATYIGWRLHGVWGGLAAGVFFVLPSVFVLLLLSWLAVARSDVPVVQGLLYGVQPVVIGIVLSALLRLGGRTLRHPVLFAFALFAFVAVYSLSVPFPIVVLLAALSGLGLSGVLPGVFSGGENTPFGEKPEVRRERPGAFRNARVLAIFVLLWAAPVGALFLWRGGGDVLVREALFFTGAAFVTFGGAYAVLAYISDVAVGEYGWLSADQMVQGLALAESTPGPLIMVTQYVGFLGAYNDPGRFDPVLYGTLGALTTTFVTFLPSFLFIFLLAPYVEILSGDRRVRAALVGVTAAVVGVIANLGVFFAGEVLFPGDGPDSFDAFALALAGVSFFLLQRFGVAVHYVVLLGALAGMLWTLFA